MDGILSLLGLQARPFRALLRTFITLDLRGQFYAQATNVKAGELISPLYWVVGQMLTVSLLFTLMLHGRVDAGFYAAAQLSATVVFVFSAVVVEFQEAAFDPADVQVVGHRPVTSRTWSAARLLNLAGYVALITIAMTLFPTAMGTALIDAPAGWILWFPWANAVCAITTASLAITLYASGNIGTPGDKLRRVAAWVQIIAIMALFYGGQVMLRNASGGLEYFSLHPPIWLTQSPTWFLGQAVANGQLLPIWIGTGVAFATSFLAFSSLRRAWARVTRVRSARRVVTLVQPSQTGTLSTTVTQRLFSTTTERAVFWLTWTQLSRDSSLRQRNLPTLAMAMASAILGVFTGQYANPAQAQGAEAALPIVTVLFAATAVPTLWHNMRSGHDHQASWRLAATWGRASANAARTAFLWRLFGPLVALHTALLLVIWSPLDALGHGLLTWALLDLVSRLMTFTLWTRPLFHRAAIRGGTLGAIPGVVAGVSAGVSVVGGLWFLAAPIPGAVYGLALLLWGLGRLSDNRWTRP